MLRTIVLTVVLSLSALAQSAPVHQFLIRLQPVRKNFSLANMTDQERPILNRHLEYLRGLFAEGKVVVAGQVLDPKGLWGLVVVEAPDQEAANAILNGDPTIKNRIFRGDAVPFNLVFERAHAAESSESSR
jgi:uncharacterized protein